MNNQVEELRVKLDHFSKLGMKQKIIFITIWLRSVANFPLFCKVFDAFFNPMVQLSCWELAMKPVAVLVKDVVLAKDGSLSEMKVFDIFLVKVRGSEGL